MDIVIRPAALPHDYPAIAAVLKSGNPSVATADELAYDDAAMTGVLRPYRGKGVATLLKLRGIRYAQEHSNQKLWVVNDAVNTAMLGLNAKLGLVRGGVNVRYLKVLA